MLIRKPTLTLLQIFCKIILNSEVNLSKVSEVQTTISRGTLKQVRVIPSMLYTIPLESAIWIYHALSITYQSRKVFVKEIVMKESFLYRVVITLILLQVFFKRLSL